MKYANIILLLLSTLVICSCSNDEELPVEQVTTNPYDASVKGTLVPADAPVWTLAPNLTYSSMSLIIDQYSIPCSVTEGDQVAAFINGECRGKATPFLDKQGKWRFNLSISAAEDDASGAQVTIRYYSATGKGIYTSYPITFTADVLLGTNTKGYSLTWL